MKVHKMRCLAAGVLMLGVLFVAGCGGGDGDSGDAGTSTQPASAKQTLDSIRQQCVESAQQAPDAESRRQGEAACRAAAADAPIGPGAPNEDEISQRLREECAEAAKGNMTAEVRDFCKGVK